MKFRCLVIIVFLLQVSLGFTQESKLWNDFKSSKQNHTEPVLPDFSFAGYMHGEEEIPKSNYKVFNVTHYGANPDDAKSDKRAIIKAISAASKNGKGIIYFPKGKYYINTKDDSLDVISITSSKIIFRGENKDNTLLFFDKDLPPIDPNKLWTCPSAIKVSAIKKNKVLTKIIGNTKRETSEIEVKDSYSIKAGDWIIVEVSNNSEELINYDIAPFDPDPSWKSLLEKGVQVNEKHQVKKVNGNTITLVEPIHFDIEAKHNWQISSFEHVNHVGFENLTFEGNWLKKFIHHRSAQDDGGWSILTISNAVNSWVKDCTFKNVNRCLSFSNSASCTSLNINIEGNLGHNAVHASRSTGVLIANCQDNAGMHHSFGVDGNSSGTVIWRSKYASHTCFEAHASQPRCTLFDKVEGGFFQGRAGGARQNLPNHGRYLVLWNFKETDDAEKDFRFVATDTWYWRIVPPIIVGFHGAGTTFKKHEVQIIESLGKPVEPESLYEAQLKLRLGKLPEWVQNLKNSQ